MPDAASIICRRCGTANSPGDEFCGSCGAFLEWEGQPAEPGSIADPAAGPGHAAGPGPAGSGPPMAASERAAGDVGDARDRAVGSDLAAAGRPGHGFLAGPTGRRPRCRPDPLPVLRDRKSGNPDVLPVLRDDPRAGRPGDRARRGHDRRRRRPPVRRPVHARPPPRPFHHPRHGPAGHRAGSRRGSSSSAAWGSCSAWGRSQPRCCSAVRGRGASRHPHPSRQRHRPPSLNRLHQAPRRNPCR